MHSAGINESKTAIRETRDDIRADITLVSIQAPRMHMLHDRTSEKGL